jgi:hypothetical protein
MTMNNQDWDKGWFYLRNDDVVLPPYTGKVLTGQPFNWGLWVSDEVMRTKLKPYLEALKTLTHNRLTAVAVLAQSHRQWVIPLMERALQINKMAEGADSDALAGSQLVAEPLAPLYKMQRAKRAVDTQKMVCDPDDVLWSPRMRPDDVLWSPRMRPDDGYIDFVRNFLPFVLISIDFGLGG